MNSSNFISTSPQSVSIWERLSFLLGRLIIIFAMVYIPLVFYTMTWRHYAVPKAASFQFLVLMLVACWGVIVCGRRFIRSAISTPAAFFFMIVMITSLVAVNLSEAWETITFLLACMIFIVIIPKFFTRLKDFEVLAYILGIVCILVDLYALAQWFSWDAFFRIVERWGVHQYTSKPVSFMGNENYTAEFLNIATPICLAMIFCHLRRPAELIFFTFVTMFNMVTMLYIDCNASYMGFLFAIPTVILLIIYYKVLPWSLDAGFLKTSRKVAEKWFRHVLVIGILLVAIVGTLIASTENKIRSKMTTMASWVDVDGDNRPDGVAPIVFRLQCMDAAIRNIQDAPVWGIGAGNFKVMHPLYESQLERKVLGEETLARKVHNDHLYHAAEFGIFGLFAWYWLVATVVYVIFRSLKLLRLQDLAEVHTDEGGQSIKHILSPYERQFYFYLQLGILGGIITAVVSCAFGHTFVIQSSATTYWLATGIGVAAFQVVRRSMAELPKPILGATKEKLTGFQRLTQYIPRPGRFIVFFLIVLPLGGANLHQLIGEMWLRQGMLAHDVHNYPATFYCFQKAMTQYPYQMEIYYILGRYYIDAIGVIDMAEQEGKEGQKRLAQTGLANYDRDELLKAGIVSLQTDIYLNPNYKWAHNNLGVLYDKLPSFKLASEAYDRVFQIDKEQIFAHYNMGLGYMRKGEFDKAIDELELALVVDPSKTEIYRFLARCFIAKQDHKRAMAAADKFLTLSIRSRAEKMRGKYSSETLMPVVRDFGTINLQEPGQEENSEDQSSDEELQALQEAQMMLQVEDQELYVIYLAIARDLFQQGKNYEMALEAMQKAEKVTSVPQDDMFYWLFGNIHFALKNYDEAIDKWETFLHIKPNNVEVRRKLTNLYASKSQFGQALETFKPIIENSSVNWEDHLSYARVLLYSGKTWNEVFNQLKKAVEVGGDAARKRIAKEDASNVLSQFYLQDPRFQELLGKFKPAIEVEQATQQNQTHPSQDIQEVTPANGASNE